MNQSINQAVRMIHGDSTDRSQQWIWYNNMTRQHWGWSHSWEHIKKDKHWIATHSLRRNTSRGIRRHNHMNIDGHTDTTDPHDIHTDITEHKYTFRNWDPNRNAIMWKTYTNMDKSQQINPYETNHIMKWDTSFTEKHTQPPSQLPKKNIRPRYVNIVGSASPTPSHGTPHQKDHNSGTPR
jgi:hypothetical protein